MNQAEQNTSSTQLPKMPRLSHCSWQLIVLFLLLFSPKLVSAQHSSLNLVFIHTVGADTLQLGKDYLNPLGDTFSVTSFKYYIFDISFIEAGTGKKYASPSQYYLINEGDTTSKTIMLQMPPGQYSAISFSLGVDSLHNVSGVQTGALDPINGMFWTWHTGYIMAKLEGKSPASTAPFGNITYHIGGFKTGENVLKQITLPLSNANLTAGNTAQLSIAADINVWFKNANDLKIAEQPFCMNPGELALKIADNYAGMFHVLGWVVSK